MNTDNADYADNRYLESVNTSSISVISVLITFIPGILNFIIAFKTTSFGGGHVQMAKPVKLLT